MALENIKATASQAVSDAVDQAYAQGAADAKAAQPTPTEGGDNSAPTPAPVPQIDVSKLVANAYNEGVVAENKRMTGIVEEAIASNDNTEKLLRQRMQITVQPGTPEESPAEA